MCILISIVPWLSPFSLNHTSLYGLINNEQVNIEEMVSRHDTTTDDDDDGDDVRDLSRKQSVNSNSVQ